MQILEEQDFLVGRVEASRVGGWCSARKAGHPGAWIILFLIRCIHAATYFSDCPQIGHGAVKIMR